MADGIHIRRYRVIVMWTEKEPPAMDVKIIEAHAPFIAHSKAIESADLGEAAGWDDPPDRVVIEVWPSE